MVEGIIIKGYSGFYYVKHKDNLIECSLRGKNRIKKSDFFPGDRVEITLMSETKGTIEKVVKRKNQLIRPAIANIDQVIIVSGIKNPTPDFQLIDRLTVLALNKRIEPIICFNKIDLATPELIEDIKQRYISTGFKIMFVNTLDDEYRQELKDIIKGKISVLAGMSGVGKTSILNYINENKELIVGDISRKLKRGKHTTRHTELMEFGENSWVADSPGFSSLAFTTEIDVYKLPLLFPDFLEYSHLCKFSNCLHLEEPGCEVKNQIKNENISESRYENYKYFNKELRERSNY